MLHYSDNAFCRYNGHTPSLELDLEISNGTHFSLFSFLVTIQIMMLTGEKKQRGTVISSDSELANIENMR